MHLPVAPLHGTQLGLDVVGKPFPCRRRALAEEEAQLIDPVDRAVGRQAGAGDLAEVTINRAAVEGKKPPIIRRKQEKEAA